MNEEIKNETADIGNISEEIIENTDTPENETDGVFTLEETSCGKKKSLPRMVYIILAIFIILSATVLGYYKYCESKANLVISNIYSGNLSAATEECHSMGLGKNLFRKEIIEKFLKYVKTDEYVSPIEDIYENPFENTCFVDSKILRRYEDYQKFCNEMNISVDDGTNVKEYIDAVLRLREYEKYTHFAECTSIFWHYYNEIADNYKMASYMFTSKARNEYIEKAQQSLEELNKRMKAYKTTSPKVETVINFANFLYTRERTLAEDDDVEIGMLRARLAEAYGEVLSKTKDDLKLIPRLY